MEKTITITSESIEANLRLTSQYISEAHGQLALGKYDEAATVMRLGSDLLNDVAVLLTSANHQNKS